MYPYLPLIYPDFIHSYPEIFNLPWVYHEKSKDNLSNSKEPKKTKSCLKVREQQEQEQEQQEEHDIDY